MKKFISTVMVLLVAIGVVYFIQNKNNLGNKAETANSPAPESNSSVVTPPAAKPAFTPTTHAVTIQGFAFNQKSISVKKGDTVVWTNKDSAPHTITGDVGDPKSPTINANGTYSFTFNAVGTFGYHCSFHPSMNGTVMVTE